MTMTLKSYFTVKEAAKKLKINTSRVRQIILAGDLNAEKVGRDWLISSVKLKDYQSRRRGPGRPIQYDDEVSEETIAIEDVATLAQEATMTKRCPRCKKDNFSHVQTCLKCGMFF